MFIIVLNLELQKIFVAVSECCQNNKSESQLLLEAELYYDYLKKYKPISILKKIQIENPLDIDKYVKLFMIEYGIDHVRGGSYSDEILSENLVNTLICELETASNPINKKHENAMNTLIQNYAYTQMSKLEMDTEYKRLENILLQFRKEKMEYESIKINSSQIIEDIKWIKIACSHFVEVFNENKTNTYLSKIINKEFIEKYKRVNLSLKKIYTICKKNDYSNKIENVYIAYPEFLLDDFFYHWHRIHIEKYTREVEELCKTYEHLINIISNKIDEKVFDISTWGDDVEWKISRALYLLDKMSERKL